MCLNYNMRNIFSLDKNNFLLKIYHKSNKLLIPILIPTLILENENYLKKYFDFLNITNFTFHSVFSFSSIITDYHKKIPFINENVLRILNIKSHSFMFIYLTYNVYNKNYRPEVYNYNELKRKQTLPIDF